MIKKNPTICQRMDAPVIILALVGIGTIVMGALILLQAQRVVARLDRDYEGVWGNGANKGKDKGQISR